LTVIIKLSIIELTYQLISFKGVDKMKLELGKNFTLLIDAFTITKILNKLLKRAFVAAFLFLTGCMGSTYSSEQLTTDFRDLDLCRAAIFHGIGSVKNTDDVIAEINRRDLVSPTEWHLVNSSNPQSRKLKLGMSECSMILVMDNNGYQVTETVTEFGVNRMYEYGSSGYGPFIMVDDGKVTSWTY